MSILESQFDQVCTCCGKKFPAWYRYDTEKKTTEITYADPCKCEAEYSPVGGAPSISEWVERVKTLKPYVAEYTITYRNTCLVWAKDAQSAQDDALEIYGEGWFDPEDNGYDGCDVDITPATPEREENLKYYSYLWDGEVKEESV